MLMNPSLIKDLSVDHYLLEIILIIFSIF